MNKVIKITGITLVVVSFLLLIAFFATLGQGTATIQSAAGEAIQVPLLTDTIMYWLYILFGVAILLSVGVAIINFTKSLMSNPVKALKALLPIIAFAGIFLVSYLVGSSEKMTIIGYDGTQNEGAWAQITDMFIYTIYTLFALVVLAIFGSRIYSALK